jgi:hypothetical protein
MKRIFLGSLLAAVAFVGSVVAFFPVAFPATTASAQTSGQFPELDKNGKPVLPRPNPWLIYSPTDLNHNAITLPASGATSPTTIIRTAGVTKMTYFVNCTQNVKVTMNVYTADDKVNPQTADFTSYGVGYDVFTAVPAGPQQIYIASELAPNGTGTGITAVNPVRLPQVAISFTETNATATAGTCTDRLVAGYN